MSEAFCSVFIKKHQDTVRAKRLRKLQREDDTGSGTWGMTEISPDKEKGRRTFPTKENQEYPNGLGSICLVSSVCSTRSRKRRGKNRHWEKGVRSQCEDDY